MSMEDEVPQSQRQLESAAVQRAVGLAVPKADIGYIFTHRWLADALDLGEKPPETTVFEPWNVRRMRLVNDWIATLLRRGIHLENSRARGYIVIDPRQTNRVVIDTVKREAKKVYTQAGDKLTLVSSDILTDAELAARHDTYTWVGLMNMMLEHQRPKPPRPGVKREIEGTVQPQEDDEE